MLKGGEEMIEESPLTPDRVRKIRGSFAFVEHLFQVLSLPDRPVQLPRHPLKSPDDMAAKDPATIRRIIGNALGGD